jgi:nucleotide-binding universal stress UspA family protein
MRLLSGNVSTGVAARATVPVVSVPETWCGERTAGVIVVGIKHLDHAEAALTEAFAVARRAGSRLRVLHAWRFPAAYDDIVVSDPATLTEWRVRAERELEALVAPWRCAHPDVEVELRTVHDYAAQALVAASEDADELVIVRRAHGVPAAAHLGSTARTVLLYAHCPVRIVPSLPVPVMRDPDLEAAGAGLKRSMA